MPLSFCFEEVRLVEAHFKRNEEFQFDEDKPVAINYVVEQTYSTKDNRVESTLSMHTAAEDAPFTFDISLMGVFVFDQLPQEEEMDKTVRINCASMVFPFLRETLADLSRRAGIPPFIAPPMNFVALYYQRMGKQTDQDSEQTSEDEQTSKEQ